MVAFLNTKNLLRAYPLEAGLLVFSLFFRFWWIEWQSPFNYNVNSDMRYYFDIGRYWAVGSFGHPKYFTHSPGIVWLFGLILKFDLGLETLKHLFVVMSFSTPLLIAAAAKNLWGTAAARFSFWFASLYPPFWMFGSFLLAELPMIFLVSLVAWLSTSYKVWMHEPRKAFFPVVLLASCLTALIALKSTAAPAIVVFILYFFIWVRAGLVPRKTLNLIVMSLVLILGLGVGSMVARCTIGTGQICFVSNKLPGEFLFGNMGRIRGVIWERGGGWTSSTAELRGWTTMRNVPYAIWDRQNFADALAWIRQNPSDWIGVVHMRISAILFDPVWPLSALESDWPLAHLSAFWFSAIVLSFAFIGWILGYKDNKIKSLFYSPEAVLMLLVLTVLMSLLFVAAEARYRIPFDPLLILLAGAGWTKIFTNTETGKLR